MLGDDEAEFTKRRGVRLPLLVFGDDNDNNNNNNNNDDGSMTLPLPSDHLPEELSTLNLYGVSLHSAAQRRLIDEAAASTSRCYGHVVSSSSTDDGLVGAVGCAVEILIAARPVAEAAEQQDLLDDQPRTSVLTRGSWRFVVREVVSTIPYPVAVVDQLNDNDNDNDDSSSDPIVYNDFGDVDEEEEEEEDDEDDYLPPVVPTDELSSRTLQAAYSYIQLLLAVPKKTPLEELILESAGKVKELQDTTRANAEEMAAVFDVFHQELVDMNSPRERKFAIAMLAAEIGGVDNAVRRSLLTTTDADARLRTVLSSLETSISMERAKSIAAQLTSGSNGADDDKDGTVADDDRDLQVGQPTLPAWVKDLKVGMRVEYFWNEEWGWCEGTVRQVEHVFDEVIVTLHFTEEGGDDDAVHRLPVTADDKVRWRPVR